MSSLLPDDDEFLEDGWSPNLFAGDSVVRQAVMVHAAWATELARSIDRPWHDGDHWAAGNGSDRGVFSNWAMLKQPGLDLAQVVTEIADVYPAGEPYILMSPWPTGDLTALGLQLLGHPPLMVRFPWAPQTGPSTDLTVRWAETPDDLAEVERVLVTGYPLPELEPVTPGCIYGPGLVDGGDGARFVLVCDGDGDGETSLATATAMSHDGITLVEGVAALSEARGRGAGAAAAWAATTAFADQPAVLLASDDGQPVYERMGYLRIERWTVWMRPLAAMPT